MSHTTDLYTTVTNQIIAALEAGTPPWVCPWDRLHGSAIPANLTTGRPYRGINVLLLNLQQIVGGYADSRRLVFSAASMAQKAVDHLIPLPDAQAAQAQAADASAEVSA